MWGPRFPCCLLLITVFVHNAQATAVNVALHKDVIADASWKECLVDGKIQNSVISPNSAPFPFYAVDLGAIYNLSSIKLYGQDQLTFGQAGLNESFNVHTYGKFVNPCELQFAKWDVLATNLTFTKRGEEIVLHPTNLVQYIIVSRDNPNYPACHDGLVMSEIMAFGMKVNDSKPQMPKDGDMNPNYYTATRRTVIGKQSTLFIEQAYGAWKPNVTLMDVPFCWHMNRINSMAVKRGKGRIIVIQGLQVMNLLEGGRIYKDLREGFTNWLSNGSRDARFREVNQHYNDGDMLLITINHRFNVDRVYNLLISGWNSAVIGYIPSSGDNYATQLLKKLNIEFYRHNDFYPARDIYLPTLIESKAYIPLPVILQGYIDSWGTFRNELMQDSFSWEDWNSRETQTKLKTLIEKYGRFMESIAPCDLLPYHSKPETLTALLNYNHLMLRQNGEIIKILPGVRRHPGNVDETLKPTNVTVTLNVDVAGAFFPTGVYAKPGEGFRWIVLNDTDPNYSEQFIRINGQTDNLKSNSDMSRWPVVTLRRPLMREGFMASPHGGPIFLQIPSNVNLTVRFENVYRHAYVDLRDPKSIEEFESALQQYKGIPWVIVAGDAMYTMMHIRSAQGKNTTDIIEAANFWDNCIKLMHNYRGTKFEEARTEVFVSDVQIMYGWGHAGYPWMGYLAWSDGFADLGRIKKGDTWGIMHELGHNLQVGPATLKNGVEVTNNIYYIVCTTHLLGMRHTVPYYGRPFSKGNIDGMVNQWKQSEYSGFQLGYYVYINALFGEGLIGNIFAKAIANSGQLSDENTKTQFWLQQVCNETGRNMIPFHKLWNAPISEETESSCQKLPCFFPDDVITRLAPEKVNEVLKKYGKDCQRSGQKTVKFKGNITRGVDKRRPQIVFLQ